MSKHLYNQSSTLTNLYYSPKVRIQTVPKSQKKSMKILKHLYTLRIVQEIQCQDAVKEREREGWARYIRLLLF